MGIGAPRERRPNSNKQRGPRRPPPAAQPFAGAGGGGTRNGVWQLPHALRPKSFTSASVPALSLALAVSRSLAASISKFFAEASNSPHFSQISFFAAVLPSSEPGGNSAGIFLAFWAMVSASVARPARSP